MECRKETAYALHKTPITKTIREKEYQFLITTAHCKECGCEVGVKGILDYNAKEIDEQFRKAEEIVSLEEIEKLGKIYSLGKAPLSIALGFGEVTITCYLAKASSSSGSICSFCDFLQTEECGCQTSLWNRSVVS